MAAGSFILPLLPDIIDFEVNNAVEGQVNNTAPTGVVLLDTDLNQINPVSITQISNYFEIVIATGSIVPAIIEINGVAFKTVDPGDTLDILIENSDLVSVGTPDSINNRVDIADSTLLIQKSDSSLIFSFDIAAEDLDFYNVADSAITVLNSLSNVVDSGNVKATESGNFTAPDADVENSDASYTDTVVSGGLLILPDQTIEVNGVNEGSIPSVGTIDIDITDGTNPVTPNNVSVVGRTVTVEVPSGGGSYDLDLVDRFGNAFPQIQITQNETIKLNDDSEPYIFVNLFKAQMDTTPTTAEEDYLGYIVSQYKAAGIWSKMHFIRPYVGSSANNNALNLKYPFKTRDAAFAVFVGSPTHNANGITHSGNSYELAYLEGRILKDLNWHMSLYSRLDTNPNVAGATDMGFSNDLNYAVFEIKSTATRSLSKGQNATSGLINPPPTSDGLFTLTCLSGTNNTKFIKNAATLIAQFTSTSIPNGNPRMLCIGAPPEDNLINYIGRAARATNRNFAMATVGDGLTDTEISNKYTIDQAAQTIMSRQV